MVQEYNTYGNIFVNRIEHVQVHVRLTNVTHKTNYKQCHTNTKYKLQNTNWVISNVYGDGVTPTNSFRWQVNHPNYNDRHKYIHKKQYNRNSNKQFKTLFLVKKYNVNLDDRKLLKDLIVKNIKAANLLKDYKIMICNKTVDNLQTIINKKSLGFFSQK